MSIKRILIGIAVIIIFIVITYFGYAWIFHTLPDEPSYYYGFIFGWLVCLIAHWMKES